LRQDAPRLHRQAQQQTVVRLTQDPLLSSFKDYTVLNEIYSIGWVLSYIFTGRQALKTGTDEVSRIVQKCGTNDTAQRYQRVIGLIADVERLEASPTGTPA
jgi:hypothetical protein